MTLLSIIVAANSYLVKEGTWTNCSMEISIQKILFIISAFGLGISIFYLTRSYNNFFKGFAYRNLGATTDIRKFENDLNDYNEKVEEIHNIKFDNIIIDKLTSIIDDHIIFNDRRSLDLHYAKTFLIVCVMLTIVNFIIFSLKLFHL
ncbi:MAG: hypothetical protein DI598_19245 [Pseudopedobacter saltans]|uniref:SMODS and SLOG-associating 2TM effector domain-containing protein n=1 Tax=Pseudopedobacter saltans TaxID=151895 RepID=A0A2W5EF08_9SPHI|nr:MAG: hypothetical protein DI598_19245 [Pseudopedobacter saltans]